MTPREFTVIAEHIWDGRGWQVRLAGELEVSPQTVSNWVNGKTPLPKIVQMYINMRWVTYIEESIN